MASSLSRSDVVSVSEVEQQQAAPKAFANSIKFSTKTICFSGIWQKAQISAGLLMYLTGYVVITECI